MARARGLGPQGREAVAGAARELPGGPGERPGGPGERLSTAPVTSPFDEPDNPANVVVDEPLGEAETLPDRWVQFDSSRVASAGYDRESQRLYVLFHKPFPGGTTWTYHGVPPNVWRNMQRSASAGRFVNRVLNGFRYNPGQWG